MLKKILKRISLIIIVFLIVLITGTASLAAFNLPNGRSYVKMVLGDMITSNDYYCVQYDTNLRNTSTTTFYVDHYVKIEGNVATAYNRNNEVIATSRPKNANSIIAYILGGGSYRSGYGTSSRPYGGNPNAYYKPRQRALYSYFNTWCSEVGNDLGIYWRDRDNDRVSQTSESRELLREAERNVSSNDDSIIKIKGSDTLITSNDYAGPFTVTFSGKLTSINVKDTDGKKITKGISFYVNDTKVDVGEISSNQKFYIKNESGKTLKDIEVNASSNGNVSAEIWFLSGTNTRGEASQRLIRVKTKQNPKSGKVTFHVKPLGSITIYKRDADTNAKLDGAEFKIKTSKGWLKKDGNKYIYNAKFDAATSFKTKDGKVEIKNLNHRSYAVYETKAPTKPEKYDLKSQQGYKDGMVYVGTAKVTENNYKIAFTHKNINKISISGYVWIDLQESKDNDSDGLCNDLEGQKNEPLVEGVKVRLINKDTKEALKIGDVDYVLTDKNGKYTFKELISAAQLDKYYVEFDYNGVKVNGQDISKYIPVKFNDENINKIKVNGSRALVEEMPEYVKDAPGKALTYNGKNDANKEKKYGLSGNLYQKLYKPESRTLDNINLGLKNIPEVEYNLEQNLADVKIVMNGYTYTYNYGSRGNKNATTAPTVNFQSKNSISAYTSAVYPSDIVYDKESKDQKLKVYVSYRIDITNTTTLGTGDAKEAMKEMYQEQKLHITSLTNKFDTNRYSLNDDNWEINDGIAKIKDSYLKDIKENGIGSEKTATKFIQFSVKRDAIHSILKNPTGIIEQFPTLATANGYHEFTREDYSWDNSIKKTQTHYTDEQEQSGKAPYLIFKLGNQRIISGTVFKDEVTAESAAANAKLGNGIYDQNEKAISNVKVELLDNNGNLTNLYDIEYTDDTKTKLKDENGKISEGSATTGEDGKFTLVGVVPGEYYLRYTYGDGTQKYKDLNGNEVTINANDYKSTIVTSEFAKMAWGDINNKAIVEESDFVKEVNGKDTTTKKKNYIWYKKLDKAYSIAIDDLDSRNKVFNKADNKIFATTPQLSITIEKTTEETNNFDGFNLGIIEQPKQEAKIEKIITNLKLTNGQGNLICEGNPETKPMQGVSDLDQTKNNGSTYLRVEMEDEKIYGSTLVLTYGIKVTNISDVNYYNEEYYKFGKADENKEVTLKPEIITDYLDETLEFVSIDDKHTVVKPAEATEVTDEQGNTVKKYILEIKGWVPIYTEKKAKDSQDRKTSDTATIVAQRGLSSKDDDMTFVNEAAITDIRNNVDPKDNKIETVKIASSEVHSNNKVKATITITPPTGADKNAIILYTIAGVATLAILSAGIVFIKKKVL